MTYDAADGYVVLFGGAADTSISPGLLGDTWKFQGGVWTNITTTSGTNRGAYIPMVYDASDGYVLLTVGSVSWAFKGGLWTNIPTNCSTAGACPPPRYGSSTIYDVADGYVVLFGGCCKTSSRDGLLDTWEFHAGVWTNVTTSAGPSPRLFTAMADDGTDGYGVLFGGVSQVPNAFPFIGTLGDTWKFVGGSWTNITTTAGPPARTLSTLAYDAADGYTLLFGGVSGTTGFFGDTWRFLAGTWTNIPTSTAPSARSNGSIAYDDADHYVVLFGGTSSAVGLGDTWTWSQLGLRSWTQRTGSKGPSPRVFPSIAYDAADGYVVFFGGVSNFSSNAVYYHDTWKFQGGLWTNITSTSGTPGYGGGRPVVGTFPMAYDAADGYVVLPLGDGVGHTWAFRAGVWMDVSGSCSKTTCPSFRYHSSMTYDGADQRILLFGGVNSSATTGQSLSDTWEFHGGVWTKIVAIVQPSGREAASMAYDVADGYVVLFGGDSIVSSSPTAYKIFGDTWKCVAGSWTNITTTSGPMPRTSSMISYDAADGYVLLFGGSNFVSATFGDTWRFSAGVWTNIPTSVSPPARDTGAMGYDEADLYVILFGGQRYPNALNDTWTWGPVVGTRTTFTQLRCYPAVIATSQSQNCMVAVTDSVAAGSSAPTGTVTLTVTGVTGTFTSSPCPLTPFLTFGGFCSFTFSATTTGGATITAHYDGDSAHATSSATFQITIANLHPTTITVVCTPTSATRNQPIMCTATVTDTSASRAVPPSGLVQLPVLNPNTSNPVGCTLVGTGATSTGTATAIIGPYAPAPPITFTQTTWFDGDTAHDGSITTVQLTLIIRTTTTTVACLPESVNIG